MPVLNEFEFCYRCQNSFRTTENSEYACVFHADADGREGQFVEQRVNGIALKAWNCCGKTAADAPVMTNQSIRFEIYYLQYFP